MKHPLSPSSLLKTTTSSLPLMAACLFGMAACASTRAAAPVAAERDGEEVITSTEIQRASAGIVGCRPSDIVVEFGNYSDFHDVWEVTCHTGRWICSRQDMIGREYFNCALLVK